LNDISLKQFENQIDVFIEAVITKEIHDSILKRIHFNFVVAIEQMGLLLELHIK
jgi:hypothetical protein